MPLPFECFDMLRCQSSVISHADMFCVFIGLMESSSSLISLNEEVTYILHISPPFLEKAEDIHKN